MTLTPEDQAAVRMVRRRVLSDERIRTWRNADEFSMLVPADVAELEEIAQQRDQLARVAVLLDRLLKDALRS